MIIALIVMSLLSSTLSLKLLGVGIGLPIRSDVRSSVGMPNLSYATFETVIIIHEDGTVDPPETPILIDGDVYTLTDNITSLTDGILIERNNTVLDGAGYTLQGNNWEYTGICVTDRRNITIENVKINTFGSGIYLFRSSNITINGNEIADNIFGIRPEWYSTNNRISQNEIATNDYGIFLVGPSVDYNEIVGNNITRSTFCGISLEFSDYNVIRDNDITWSNYSGAQIQSDSLHNVIYHNNFEHNSMQAYSTSTTNTWHGGYPSGGNYWSDYNGTDLLRGVYQNITGSDGIGDSSYAIDMNNTDSYPLMGSFGTSTTTGLNATVFPAPDIGVIFENVTEAGSTTANKTQAGPLLPPGATLVGQYYNITTTAAFSGNVTVRIIYDDSNMTQEQENNLQLLQWCLQPCDVTGPTGVPDEVVNMRDIGYFCGKFMTTPSSSNWDPNCDVTGPGGVPDSVVNMRDIGEACSEFMTTSYWMNVTVYVDTVNNVIYGETNHFSMFGVTRW